MWTLFRFALFEADARAYREAYAILARAGFRRARAASPRRTTAAQFPAAVLADVRDEPSAVTRSIFEVLGEARLRPVGVTACALAPARAPAAPPGVHG